MTRTKLYPVTVTPYSVGCVADAIRHLTGWEQRSEVLDKTHLTYLNRYVNKLDVRTMVIENEYIDRHYIEDYAEYYARCFYKHPRTCSRIHFFRNEFNEVNFIGAVSGTNIELISEIHKNYLGFVVLRPIPKTCIARMCLRPYEFNEIKVKIQKSTQCVSLFGIDLSIETLPFLEQDKVVSACATSAIWVLLSAHQKAAQDALPSPSAITKSAFSPQFDENRVFPAHGGLNLQQVARSLKAYGLEPTIFNAEYLGPDKFLSIVKEILFAYGASGIPVLLGVETCKIVSGREEKLGLHLVCALGYRVKTSSSECSLGPTAIDRVYVHDDRYGPYVALESSDKNCLQLMWGDTDKSELRENMYPKSIVIGLYHKVRIDYLYVRNLCAAMKKIVKALYEFLSSSDFADTYTSVSSVLQKFLDSNFVITLETVGLLKGRIRQSKDFFSYNGVADKAALLLENFPKYIWSCSFFDGNARFVDFLVDATEVPQGNLILGGIQYSEEADQFWRYSKTLINSPSTSVGLATNCAVEARQFLSAFCRFFAAKDNDALNSYYGQVRLPNRPVRQAEVDDIGNIVPLKDTRYFNFQEDPSESLLTLNKEATYLWVIDEDGTLILGREESVNDHKSRPAGHPSLTKSRAARLGGELKYDGVKWLLNTRSATYSNHIYTLEARNTYLSNVIRLNFANNDSVGMSEEM